MPHVSTRPGDRVHFLVRRPAKPALDLSCRSVRPSLLDQRFVCDVWIVGAGPGLLTLCLGTYPLAQIQALPLDLPALNQLVDRVRTRRPRRPGVLARPTRR